MARLSEDQKLFLRFLPNDGTAIGGYPLFAQLQEANWRTREIERVMGELREIGAIIVGRGGSGGSIRHVKNDQRALLESITEFEAEETTCTRQSLQQYMKWHPDYLEQVLDVLQERGKIAIGPGGGGGVITLAQPDEEEEEETETRIVDDPAEDERRLLGLIPQIGSVSNTRLRSELTKNHDWDEERYWETRKRLRQKGLIEVGKGRGGSVRRVNIDTVVSSEEPIREPIQSEPQELHDETDVWQNLPENGEVVELGDLQRLLKWSPDRFFGTLERLATTHRIHWSNSRVKRLIPDPSPVASPLPVAPPPTPPVDPFAALLGFFLERFDADSLQRFLEGHLGALTVSQSINWNNPLADIAYRAAAVLKRENYIDAELFDKLRAYFPRLHPQVNKLAILWLTP